MPLRRRAIANGWKCATPGTFPFPTIPAIVMSVAVFPGNRVIYVSFSSTSRAAGIGKAGRGDCPVYRREGVTVVWRCASGGVTAPARRLGGECIFCGGSGASRGMPHRWGGGVRNSCFSRSPHFRKHPLRPLLRTALPDSADRLRFCSYCFNARKACHPSHKNPTVASRVSPSSTK